MTSAMTRNQVVSFIVSVVICLFLILAGWPPVTNLLTQWASPWFVDTIAAFSVMTHFDSIQKGVIDSRDVSVFPFGHRLFPLHHQRDHPRASRRLTSSWIP